MEDARLRYFCKVVECAGFSRAAQTCGLTQSAISHVIKNLESQLNVQLLRRQGRNISLTPAGRLFYRRARAILAGYAHLTEDIQELLGVVKGDLHLGAGSTAANHLLPQLLYAFGRRHPQVCSRVIIQDIQTLKNRLAEGNLDFAIVEGARPEGFELKQFDFVEELVENKFILIAPENHPLADQKELAPDILHQEPFIVVDESGSGSVHGNRRVEAVGLDPSVLQVRVMAGSSELAIQMVKAGLGLAVVSQWAAFREIREGLVVALQSDAPERTDCFLLLRTEEAPVTAVSRAFLQFVRDFTFFTPF